MYNTNKQEMSNPCYCIESQTEAQGGFSSAAPNLAPNKHQSKSTFYLGQDWVKAWKMQDKYPQGWPTRPEVYPRDTYIEYWGDDNPISISTIMSHRSNTSQSIFDQYNLAKFCDVSREKCSQVRTNETFMVSKYSCFPAHVLIQLVNATQLNLLPFQNNLMW